MLGDARERLGQAQAYDESCCVRWPCGGRGLRPLRTHWATKRSLAGTFHPTGHRGYCMPVGSLRLVSLFVVALLAWAALGCASPTPTPTAYPEATPAPDGHHIGNWQVFDSEEDGTGARLHGIATVSSEYTASMLIRCSERTGLETGVFYSVEFDTYEDSVSVRGVIDGEERSWNWEMNPTYDTLWSGDSERLAFWLQENADETLFFSTEPANEPARYDRYELTGVDRALWQVLPCDVSKFTNSEP